MTKVIAGKLFNTSFGRIIVYNERGGYSKTDYAYF